MPETGWAPAGLPLAPPQPTAHGHEKPEHRHPAGSPAAASVPGSGKAPQQREHRPRPGAAGTPRAVRLLGPQPWGRTEHGRSDQTAMDGNSFPQPSGEGHQAIPVVSPKGGDSRCRSPTPETTPVPWQMQVAAGPPAPTSPTGTRGCSGARGQPGRPEQGPAQCSPCRTAGPSGRAAESRGHTDILFRRLSTRAPAQDRTEPPEETPGKSQLDWSQTPRVTCYHGANVATSASHGPRVAAVSGATPPPARSICCQD